MSAAKRYREEDRQRFSQISPRAKFGVRDRFHNTHRKWALISQYHIEFLSPFNRPSIVSTAPRASSSAAGSRERTTIWLWNRPSLNEG